MLGDVGRTEHIHSEVRDDDVRVLVRRTVQNVLRSACSQYAAASHMEDCSSLQVSVNDAVIVEILQPHETFDLTRGTGQVTHRKRSAQLVSQTFRFMFNYEESVKGRT